MSQLCEQFADAVSTCGIASTRGRSNKECGRSGKELCVNTDPGSSVPSRGRVKHVLPAGWPWPLYADLGNSSASDVPNLSIDVMGSLQNNREKEH